MADRIIVLHDGSVVEAGSHDDLLAKGGIYATLFNLQARGYREGPQPAFSGTSADATN
jgi:ATP-binding cassette subfamily B protein